jgi:hypothetical protein
VQSTLDQLSGSPRTESALGHSPVPQVILLVGGGFGSSTTSRRRTSHRPLKSTRLPRLLGLHQRCTTLTKRPPGPNGASNLVERAQALEVQGSLQATRLSPPFCASNLVGRTRALDGHGVLQATRSQPTFLRHQPRQPVEPRTIPGRQDPRFLDDYFTFARALGDPPTTSSTTQLVGSGTHSTSD